MTLPDSPQDPASALVDAAHAFHRVAEARGSHTATSESLASRQKALQVLRAAWYRLAADAISRHVQRDAISRHVQRTRVAAVDPGASPRRGGRQRSGASGMTSLTAKSRSEARALL
jgi:hypothetical protein